MNFPFMGFEKVLNDILLNYASIVELLTIEHIHLP